MASKEFKVTDPDTGKVIFRVVAKTDPTKDFGRTGTSFAYPTLGHITLIIPDDIARTGKERQSVIPAEGLNQVSIDLALYDRIQEVLALARQYLREQGL